MRAKKTRLILFDETGLSKERIHSLKLVILAVAFGTVCFNITGGVAMTGYLKQLGVSDFAYGLILGIGPFTTVFQIFASYILERTLKRKFIFMLSGILQRTAWLPFGLVPIIMPMSGPMAQIWAAVLFFLVSSLSGPFVNVSFFSFAADIVPGHIRGRYFSIRSRIATVFGIAGGFLTAFLLDAFSGFSGYALVFALASLFGLLDILTFIFIKFPPMAESQSSSKLIPMLKDVLTHKKYMQIIIFITIWLFTQQISGPFYLVYARTVLNLSNTAITLIFQILNSICLLIVLPLWGRALDKYGNKPIMAISARLGCILPFLWVFIVPGHYSYIPIIFASASAGLLVAGLDFGAQNLFLGQAPEKNRSMFVAIYFSITSIIGLGLAGMTGGWLLDNVFAPLEAMGYTLFGIELNRYNYIFGVTAILRAFTAIVLLPRMIKEENTQPVKTVFIDAVHFIKQRRQFIARRLKRM